MTPAYEQDVNRGSAAAGIDDPARVGGRLGGLRAYLRGVARVNALEPDEELALCRLIDAELRALAEALLAVPSAARRLRALSGVAGETTASRRVAATCARTPRMKS